MDDHAEISMIATPELPHKMKTHEEVSKPKLNTPRSKVKSTPSGKKTLTDIEPSPSVLTKKKPSPKSAKKNIATLAEDSSIISRPRRNVVRKPIFDSEEESDKENELNLSDDTSYSDSDILTDDNSEHGSEKEILKPKSSRKNPAGASSTSKGRAKKANKNELIFLDLSSEEIVRVDENFHANVSEEDLANITRKFLETDLNDGE